MFSLIVFIGLAILVAAVVGLAIKFALDHIGSHNEITWAEYLVVLLIISPIVAVLVGVFGWRAGVSSVLQFNEHWNGWETAAIWEHITCTKDGPCRWEYNCESYPCNPHPCNCVCTSRDEDGRCTSESCQTCWDTCYHDCPYCTEEWTFIVQTTLGDYTIAEHRLPDNPEAHRWTGTRDYRSSLGDVPNRAGVGVPEFWLGVLERTHNNTVPGGPVSDVRQYDNYILASQKTLLKAYSSDIERFLAASLLPAMNYSIHDYYWTDKVHFIGWVPRDPQVWQMAFHYLAAALGTDREGDPRLVVIQSDDVSINPDTYVLALKAYWQTPEWKNGEGKMATLWGDDCLSKNGVIIIVGTRDGETVDWARLQTTMPQGNEWLEDTDLVNRTLRGLPLTSEALIGTVRGEYYTKIYDDGRPPKQKIRGTFSGGAIAQLLWGLTPSGEDDPDNPGFIRVSMSGDDPEDVGTGYLFLKGEIQPTSKQKFGIVFWTFVLCAVAWWAVAAIGERTWRGRYGRYY